MGDASGEESDQCFPRTHQVTFDPKFLMVRPADFHCCNHDFNSWSRGQQGQRAFHNDFLVPEGLHPHQIGQTIVRQPHAAAVLRSVKEDCHQPLGSGYPWDLVLPYERS